jgi:hypothetical protein
MTDQNLPGDANTNQGASGAKPTQAPQPPTPTLSARLSIHTVTPPIPARQTSITASETGSYTLRSPFTFGGFGPSTLPDPELRRQSDLIRDAINTAYAQGRKDGSRYGSIGGSQIIHVEGSHTPSPTTSQLVRDQQGIIDPSMLWDETDVNFPPLPTVPPLRRDSEDSRAADFVGEDLTTNVDYHPENLQTKPVLPNIQVRSDVLADEHTSVATGGATATTPKQTVADRIRTFHISDDSPRDPRQTAPPVPNPDKKIAKKTYDSQKSSVTKLINKFRSDPMLTEKDYNDIEQRLFALVNDMGLNFAKYSTLITISAELNDVEEDYRVRYTEAKSVLDNIADWRRNLTQPTSTAATSAAPISVATSFASQTSIAPTVSVATSHVQTSTNKPPSVDGAKAPSLTLDGSSRVQTRIPYSVTSTSVQVSTYPDTLPISSSTPKNVTFSLPTFVTTGTRPKDSYQPFFTPDTTQMTTPTGVTTVTSSTTTRPSVFPNVRSQSFVPQQTLPIVNNLGSDRGTDFLDPRNRRQNKKRGSGQQQQQQRPPPQTQQQQRQSPPFSDYQKKFDYMEKQIAEQKRLLAEALRMKPPSEADLLQKIRRELAVEAAARNPGSSQRNAPGNPEQTRSSAPHSAPQSQPSQDLRTDASHGRMDTHPDHG